MAEGELLAAFGREVPPVFGGVAPEHGLALRRVGPGLFVLESARCRVKIRYGSGHLPDVDLTLSPASTKPPDYDRVGEDEYGLGLVLESFDDPAVSFAPRPLRRAEDVRPELERAAQMLRRHCAPILAGDFSRWPALAKLAEEKFREWQRQHGRGGRAARVWQTRAEAQTAFGRWDYARAAALYESVRDDLNESELKKLAYARARS